MGLHNLFGQRNHTLEGTSCVHLPKPSIQSRVTSSLDRSPTNSQQRCWMLSDPEGSLGYTTSDLPPAGLLARVWPFSWFSIHLTVHLPSLHSVIPNTRMLRHSVNSLSRFEVYNIPCSLVSRKPVT